MTEKSLNKKMLMVSVALLFAAAVAVFVTYSWILNQKKLLTATWIKTPIVLTIGSGNNHDIKYLDMGDIDVKSESSKDYVICVYGTPVDNYSLQLAYTTNIAFNYEIYRASETTDTANAILSTYTDEKGITYKEYFKISDTDTKPIISAKSLTELSSGEIQAHQSHHMSYGDEEGENAVDAEKVQSNAEPLYWLAEEDGTNVLKPKNHVELGDGTVAFLDYFIIRVSWNPDKVENDKETDIVYLTASR